MRELASPKALNRIPFELQHRPYTTIMHSKGNSLTLRLESKQRSKDAHSTDIHRIKQQIS